MYIAIICFPGCDVVSSEINLVFLIKPFFYMTIKSEKKFKYLENKRAFKAKYKVFFIICKGISVAKNCLRPESANVKNAKLPYMIKCAYFVTFTKNYRMTWERQRVYGSDEISNENVYI